MEYASNLFIWAVPVRSCGWRNVWRIKHLCVVQGAISSWGWRGVQDLGRLKSVLQFELTAQLYLFWKYYLLLQRVTWPYFLFLSLLLEGIDAFFFKKKRSYKLIMRLYFGFECIKQIRGSRCKAKTLRLLRLLLFVSNIKLGKHKATRKKWHLGQQ